MKSILLDSKNSSKKSLFLFARRDWLCDKVSFSRVFFISIQQMFGSIRAIWLIAKEKWV